MSDISTISFHIDFPLIPQEARRYTYQSKDLPDHETDTTYINGTFRADGLFVREDGLWNPSLNGWLRLIAEFGPYEFSLHLIGGRAKEVIVGRKLPDGGEMADGSDSLWRSLVS